MLGENIYKEKYCVYIDILGFKGLISELEHNSAKFDAVRAVLRKIHTPQKVTKKAWYTEFRAQSISDAVAISTLPSGIGLLEILHAVKDLAIELLKEGYFIRGAIVKGSLYHDDQMIFGDALVQAFELESNIVKFPRVMITRKVLDDLLDYAASEEFKGGTFGDWAVQAEDGPYFVDVLKDFAGKSYHSEPQVPGKSQQLRDVRDQITKRLNESIDNPHHFEKVLWFVKYWNNHTPSWLWAPEPGSYDADGIAP